MRESKLEYCRQSALSSHPTFFVARTRGAVVQLTRHRSVHHHHHQQNTTLSATRRVHGSNNTKHPPSRPFRQSARDPREVVHWLRPATTRVRTATLGSACLPHPPPLLPAPTVTKDRTPPSFGFPVVLPSTHRTAPLPLAAQACLLLPAPVQSALSSHYNPLRSLSPHVHPASSAETLWPPANTIVSHTSALYRQPCQQHMVSHSTVCPSESPLSPCPAGPAASTLSHPIQFHHMLTVLASNL
jgi:hypothetical protein